MHMQNEQNTQSATQMGDFWSMMPDQPGANLAARYKSPFAAKVRCDTWLVKSGCCKTIGPPPKMCIKCPCRYLKKHSRQVPVFFSRGDLRVTGNLNDRLSKFIYHEPLPEKPPVPSLNTGMSSSRRNNCPIPRPLSKTGLFRSPRELPYEDRTQKYKNNIDYSREDDFILGDLIKLSAELEKKGTNAEFHRHHSGGDGDASSSSMTSKSKGPPPKDYIRSNALHVVRMPARRIHRCYIDQCGSHIIDMSEAPYVLRPSFGKVPAYLHQRKMEQNCQDLQRKKQLMTDHGPSQKRMQRVEEDEKQTVILGLKNYWETLFKEYDSLPVSSIDDEAARQKRHQLEERMKEVDKDIRMLTESETLFVGNIKESERTLS